MPKNTIAAKFRAWADGLDASIAHLGRPMTQNPTPKRNRDYQSRLHDCRNTERLQRALRALADRHEAGDVPASLAELKTRDEIRNLVRKGLDHSRGGYYSVIEADDYADTSHRARQLQGLIDAGSALREHKRKLGALEAEIALANIPGYFPTPDPVVRLMLHRARLSDGLKVLEPSAGSGNLAAAATASGCTVDCIETNYRLRELLTLKGYKLTGADFLETECPAQYDRVLMNPPFEKQQDIEHVRRAFDCLKPGGILVAIMSPSFEFRSDRKSRDFRDWLADVNGAWENLPDGSFKSSGTGVSTRLLVIERPALPQSKVLAAPATLPNLAPGLVQTLFGAVEVQKSARGARPAIAPPTVQLSLFGGGAA